MGLRGLPVALGNACSTRLGNVNTVAMLPLAELDQLQLKGIFKDIRGLSGMFSICARWKMRGFWFLGGLVCFCFSLEEYVFVSSLYI